MKFYIILIIALLTLSFSQDAKSKKTTIQPSPHSGVKVKDVTTSWEEEDRKIENSELQQALEQLRKEFALAREDIVQAYNYKIEPLKKQRSQDLGNLKKDFSAKRDALRKKYASESKKKRPKKRKKDINNPDKKKKPVRSSSINIKDTPRSKDIKKKESEDSSSKDEKNKPAKK